MLKAHIIKLEEIKNRNKEITRSINSGMLFIYPTDTIYGLGCDAMNSRAVRKLRKLKKRYIKPLSIIAPSKSWILENCHIKKKFLIYLNRLPGPFTFLLNLKRKQAVSPDVTNNNTLGIRIPKHSFTKLIQKLGKPFITTSVNLAGKPHINSIKEIPWRIRRHCTIIDAGKLEGKPSTILDLTQDRAGIIGR